MQDDENSGREAAQEAGAAALGALVGLAIGGPEGSVIGAVATPYLQPVLAKVWDEVRSDGRRRAGSVAQIAADSLGDDAAAFGDRASATEQTRLLTATAMDGAVRTAWGPKVRALGRALADGLADDGARVDEEQLIIGALVDVEVPHAHVLDLLVTKKWSYVPNDAPPPDIRWVACELAERERPPRRYPEWRPHELSSALPNVAPIVPTILGTLQRHGLATPRYDISEALDGFASDNGDGTFSIGADLGPTEPTVSWSATELGLHLHTLLHDASQDE
ncbi:MAG: hypothetical protein QM572_15725 [Nocardioides sp.]|uniref:hypothetical protein n=1 Tax=Nocardioides sp. TaxID=35761 RepID=UPI0039E253B0